MSRGYACIGLDNPKCKDNVGGVLRAAFVYEAGMVAISGHRYERRSTDTFKSFKHLPLLHTNDLKEVVPYDCIPVAIELTDESESLISFKHPERAFYVFGAEDGTLGRRVLSWCKHKVQIPTRRCMNLAACVNVVLYDRMAKQRGGDE